MTKPQAHTAIEFAFLKRVLIIVAVGALIWTAWLLSQVILLVFGSILIATMLRALSAPLSRQTGIGNRWAVAIVGVLLLGALTFTFVLFGAELSTQMQGLSERLSAAYKELLERLNIGSLSDLLKGSEAASSLGSFAASLFAWSASFLGALASLALVIFGGVYIAADPGLYRAGLLKLVPPAVHSEIEKALDDIGEALRRWLGAQLIAMALVGCLTGVGFWLIGLPSALALGLIAGIAEFVPIVGPIAASIPAVLVASTQGWESMLWALGIIIVVQQIENFLISPLIVGSRVAIPPAVALFGIVSMGVLFGPLGVLLGFPLAIVFDVAVRRLYVLDMLGKRVEILGRQVHKGD